MMDSSHPSPLPPPPRAITPRVRRRSWHERPVRVWLIVLVLVGSAAAFFTWVRVAETLRERAIIFRGEEVIATVTAIEGSTIPNRKEANVSGLRVVLSYQTAGGTEVRDAWGRLQPSEPPQIAVGDTIHVRIDPLKPENWTTRRTPRSWTAELLFVWMLAPLLGLILAMILLSRRRVLSIWRDGVATEGLVIDARQSSIAPRSKMIRYVHADGEDQTVRAVLCPAGLAPAGGQPIRIVHAPGNPDRAIAADLYL